MIVYDKLCDLPMDHHGQWWIIIDYDGENWADMAPTRLWVKGGREAAPWIYSMNIPWISPCWNEKHTHIFHDVNVQWKSISWLIFHSKIAIQKYSIDSGYNISLTWIKAILGWFPLLTMIPGFGRSEVTIFYPDKWIFMDINYRYINA